MATATHAGRLHAGAPLPLAARVLKRSMDMIPPDEHVRRPYCHAQRACHVARRWRPYSAARDASKRAERLFSRSFPRSRRVRINLHTLCNRLHTQALTAGFFRTRVRPPRQVAELAELMRTRAGVGR